MNNEHVELALEIKKASPMPLESTDNVEFFKRSELMIARGIASELSKCNEHFVSDMDGVWEDEWSERFDNLETDLGEFIFTDSETGCEARVKCYWGCVLVLWINEVGGMSLSAFEV